MTLMIKRRTSLHLLTTAAVALLLATTPAGAAPGAHGPNGEHLDGPTTVRAASSLPRVEAKSEAFELVAELRAGELAIHVDLKAMAAFRAEQGDYVVTDAAMLKALAAPGEHGLVFTLVAGQDSDLLDGTLVGTATRVATAATQDHDHAHDGDDPGHDHGLERTAWIGAGVAALGLTGGVVWWRQRRRNAGKREGGL
jgi:hypothetical protein